MKSHFAEPRKAIGTICAACLLSAALARPVRAQTQAEPSKTATGDTRAPVPGSREYSERWRATSVDRSYKLKYAQSPQDANELLTAMRNMLDPQTKIFLVPSTGVIVVHAPEDTQATVAGMLAMLDQPRPQYRLTYTLTELDGSRKIGVQHFSMIATPGQHSVLKEGSRLPIQVSNTQSTYIDVGVSFDAAFSETLGGAVLKSKVEQTSVAPDSVSPSNPNPLIRQTLLEGTASLMLNKPMPLGSLDVPSSTRHFDVEVLMEPVR